MSEILYSILLRRPVAQELMALIDARLSSLVREASGRVDAAFPALRTEIDALKRAGMKLVVFHDGTEETTVHLTTDQAEALLGLRYDPLLDISPDLRQALDDLIAQFPVIDTPVPEVETQLRDDMRSLTALMAQRLANTDRYQTLLREWLEAHGLRACSQGWADASGRLIPGNWVRRLMNELTGQFMPAALRQKILESDPLAFTSVPKKLRTTELAT